MSKSIKLKNNIYLSQDSIGIIIFEGRTPTPSTFDLPESIWEYKYVDFIIHRGVDYGQAIARVYSNNYDQVVSHANAIYTDSNSQLFILSVKISINNKTVTFTPKNFNIYGHTVQYDTNNQFYLFKIIGYK